MSVVFTILASKSPVSGSWIIHDYPIWILITSTILVVMLVITSVINSYYYDHCYYEYCHHHNHNHDNVNPGLINHGLLIRGVFPQNRHDDTFLWYLPN